MTVHTAPRNAKNRQMQILNRSIGLLTCMVVLFAVVFGWQSWRQTKEDEIKLLSTVMALGEKAIDSYFSLLETSLRAVSDDLLTDGGLTDLPRAQRLVIRFNELHPGIVSVVLVGLDGQVMVSTAVKPGELLPSLKSTPSFVLSRDSMLEGANFLIGRPVFGISTKRWILPLRYAVRNASGQLEAILIAAMPVDLLQTFWKDAPIVKRASIGLIADDGYLLSRYPVAQAVPLETVYGQPRKGALRAFLIDNKFPVNGHVEGFNVLGGANYLNVFQRLGRHSATLFIALPEEELRTTWWMDVKAVYYLLALLVIGVCGIYVAARRQQFAWSAAQARSQAATEQLAAIVASSDDAIISTTLDGILNSWNPGATRLLGYLESEVLGRPIGLLLPPHQPDDGAGNIGNLDESAWIERKESQRRHKDGSLVDVELTISPLKDDTGKVVGASNIIRDITNRKKYEGKIHHLAYYDALTGLPNRRMLMDRLAQAMALSKRTLQMSAVLFLDLDHFKNINDARGHAIGDMVLRRVADGLGGLLRSGDTIARIGGDEFVIVIAGLGSEPEVCARFAMTVTEKIHSFLALSFEVDSHRYNIGASIGVSLFPSGDQSVDDVLREADTAMYRAKSAGRKRTEFFESAMQTEVEDRLALEAELGRAILENQLEMYFQPQISASGHVAGGELLMRWHHPVRGFVPPSRFIPLAEQTGLIIPLGNWVLQQGCEILLRLKQSGHEFPLSINVSPRQFRQPDFVSQVRQVLTGTGANAAMIIFEVTEGLLIDNFDETVSRMHELASLGIRFSIDDFGTGYSNLAYLKKLPLYELKIDKSFVDDTPTDANDTAIVQMIMSMARHLGLRVVAEGVETQQQADFLFQANCDCLQGYLFARPMRVTEWLAREAGCTIV